MSTMAGTGVARAENAPIKKPKTELNGPYVLPPPRFRDTAINTNKNAMSQLGSTLFSL